MAGSLLESRGTRWDDSLERYQAGEWRAPIFRDLVLNEIANVPGPARVLDIGCGRGFDDDFKLQASIAQASGTYVGIEPDETVELPPLYQEEYRCCFEDAPLPAASIDVAFAVMVLEHLSDPARFWNKLAEVLCEGGVFLGFTMDARHWFCTASAWAERMKIKDRYLQHVVGRKTDGRYVNYPVQYLCNTPDQLLKYAARRFECEFRNFDRVGQCDYYLPRPLQGIGRFLDERALRAGKPGTLLAVRALKR
jgi:SAM-dependent methyltransferase